MMSVMVYDTNTKTRQSDKTNRKTRQRRSSRRIYLPTVFMGAPRNLDSCYEDETKGRDERTRRKGRIRIILG